MYHLQLFNPRVCLLTVAFGKGAADHRDLGLQPRAGERRP